MDSIFNSTPMGLGIIIEKLDSIFNFNIDELFDIYNNVIPKIYSSYLNSIHESGIIDIPYEKIMDEMSQDLYNTDKRLVFSSVLNISILIFEEMYTTHFESRLPMTINNSIEMIDTYEFYKLLDNSLYKYQQLIEMEEREMEEEIVTMSVIFDILKNIKTRISIPLNNSTNLFLHYLFLKDKNVYFKLKDDIIKIGE